MKAEDYVNKWISEREVNSIWYIVSAMYRTGLCAKCIVEDSSNNINNCNNKNCLNLKKNENNY